MAENKYAGTQTEKNLEAAFAGESQARNKYTYFASVAKKEGYEQISALFLRQRTMRRSTRRCGSRNCRASATLRRTWRQRLRARIMSGPTCTTALQRPLRRKVSGAGAKIPSGGRNRAPSRRALPGTAEERGDSSGICQERG